MVIVVMGISGSGKTTVGELLAERLDLPFYDGDDFHPPSNVEKMRAGRPLTDQDRLPWLERIGAAMQEWEQADGGVVACSALKESYRAILKAASPRAIFVFLDGSADLIAERMRSRPDHFFPPRLIESQLETLERPGDAVTVDIDRSPEEIVQKIVEQLPERGPRKGTR